MHFVCEHLEPRQLLAATLGDDFVPVSGLGHAIEARADINGDGVLDVLGRTGAFTDRRWVLSIGRADGSFVAGSELPVIGRARTGRDARVAEVVIAGRFTGDEHVDLLVVRKRVMGAGVRVRLLVGDSTGSFTAGPQSMLALRFDTGALAAQFDGLAGRATLVSTQIDEVVGVTFADTLRPAQPVVLVSHRGAALLAVADADDDGREDLLVREPDVVTGSPVSVAIYQSVGSAGMPVLARHAVATTDAYPVLADMDGDGLLDLVFTSGIDVVSSRNLGLGLDLPGFAAPTVLFTLDEPPYDENDSGVVSVGDVDGDGRADVLVERDRFVYYRQSYIESSVSLYFGGEGGVFAARHFGVISTEFTNSNYATTFAPSGFRMIDLGGDGLMDLTDGSRVLRSLSDDARVPLTIASLTITEHDPLRAGRVLTASSVLDDMDVTRIDFGLDLDRDGAWTAADTIVGRDGRPSSAGAWMKTLSPDFNYGGAGVRTFFARALDSWGFFGPAASVDVVIEGVTDIAPIGATPPSPATLTGEPQTVNEQRDLPLAVADFTGDGLPDLLVYGRDAQNVFGVFMKRGLRPSAAAPDVPRYGALRRVLTAAQTGGVNPTLVLVAPFTSGGELDVVLVRTTSGFQQEIVLLKNDGAGNLTPMPVVLTYDSLRRVSDAALDGPGARQSLLIIDGKKKEMRAIKFNDAGAVATSRVVAEGKELRVDLSYEYSKQPDIHADFDGDGREDILIHRTFGARATLQLLLSRGGGRFESRIILTTADSYFESAAVGDVDNDGVPDVLVVSRGYGAAPGYAQFETITAYRTIRVDAGVGGVRFDEAREVYRASVDPLSEGYVEISILSVGDLTGDGSADVTIELIREDNAMFTGPITTTDAAIVIENLWDTSGAATAPTVTTLLYAGRPRQQLWLGGVFYVADADGDGVLDLFRRDAGLELWRVG